MKKRLDFIDQIPKYLTFDDVLMKPKLSIVKSRSEVNLKSKLTKNIELNFPIIASNMDTVCEDSMAIAMAKFGGIGILHRYMSINDQVSMVKRVKRHINYIIDNPYIVLVTDTIKSVKKLRETKKVTTFLVTDDATHLLGIITKRDLLFSLDNDLVKDIMTPRNKLIVGNLDIDTESAFKILKQYRFEQLPIVDKNNILHGMITLKDIIYHKKYKDTFSLDKNKRLLVGAAIGVNKDYIDRSEKLVQAGVDILVIDIAHGHSILACNATKKIKSLFPDTDVIVGNVCTSEGIKYLAKAGADAIKVNIGAGSICTTRRVTGFGLPQFSALIECYHEAKKYNIPIISDGGNSGSIGSICKAFAIGAGSVMLGRRLAGCDESPGQVLIKDGKKVKIIRGMAGYGANISKNTRLNISSDMSDMTPEGVEGYVPYKGSVRAILHQIKKGLQSSCSYGGVNKLKDLCNNTDFIKITGNGLRESKSHGINKL